MEVQFTVTDLATVAGCGGATLLLLQLLVKPLLGAIGGPIPTDRFERWRPLAINGGGLVISIGLAFGAQAVAGITYESAIQAFLTGLGGGSVAIAAYEAGKSAVKAAGWPLIFALVPIMGFPRW